MIKWEDDSGPLRHTGTDGLGVVVSVKQALTGEDDQALLHVNILVYLETPIVNPRPAIEAAIDILRKELGMEDK